MGELLQAAPIKIETLGSMTLAATWEDLAALHAKISKASVAIKTVKVDGTNAHFGYKYVSYQQTAFEVRNALAGNGVAFTIGQSDMQQHGTMTTLRLEAQFTDTETGATKILYGYGMGQDTQDKGASKALTNAVKYLLMRMFLFSDKEGDTDADGPIEQAEEQSPKAVGWESWPEKKRKGFWATCNEYGLDRNTVHNEFGVESMKDYTETMDVAREVLGILEYAVVNCNLTMKQAHEALGVDAVCKFTGGPSAVRNKIGVFVENNARVQEQLNTGE